MAQGSHGATVAALTAGAIGSIGGPMIALAAAAAGAYAGSLGGALDGLGNHEDLPAPRPAGIMFSVRISDPATENRVIDTLHAEGAADIERGDGEWRNGDWVYFNPVTAPHFVDDAPH
jgi:hypothetical protein